MPTIKPYLGIREDGKFVFRTDKVLAKSKIIKMQNILTPWGVDDPISDQLVNGTFDEDESLFLWMYLCENASPNSVAIDVGAFSGIYSLTAASIRPDMLAIAFEPSAVTYGRLVQNIQLNELQQSILPMHNAAWKTNEMITLPHQYGLFTLCPGEALGGQEADHHETVMAYTIDSVVFDRIGQAQSSVFEGKFPIKSIVAVKIDVEGAEPEVLKGCTKIIKQFRPAFLCEFFYEQDFQTLQGFFQSVDYKVQRIAEERNLIAMPSDRFDIEIKGFEDYKSTF